MVEFALPTLIEGIKWSGNNLFCCLFALKARSERVFKLA